MRRRTLLPLLLCSMLLPWSLATRAAPPEADATLVKAGQYLAEAGDCAGCHGKSFAGGDPVPTPIGQVYASNITPDVATGIGGWSLAQFSDALRKGRAPDGQLYPAMPYTSYTGLGPDEIRALYAYFMHGVQPVSHRARETDLPFPFVRAAMAPWNALFLTEGQPTGAITVSGSQLQRGRQLVESLGHCTACHSPRGTFMQQSAGHHLGGAMVGGWWAPNITSDATGIGGWSDEKLTRFLRTGHTDVAVAAGEMGTVVSRSLSRLTPEDIGAVVVYLRAVPAVVSSQPQRSDPADAAPLRITAIEPDESADWQRLLAHDSLQGSVLYQGACASCHGVDGDGSAALVHPSLRRIGSVSSATSATLVQVIAHGVDRVVGEQHTFMPPFKNSLNDAQIASVANFVRTRFGGVQSELQPSQAATILSGRVATPWLIEHAKWLSIAAVGAAALVLLAILWRLAKPRSA